MMIDRNTLCGLIPHAGDMCLIDTVLSWDNTKITCESSSHLSPQNPLLNDNKLASVHLVEYGAQAIAVHAGLLAHQKGGRVIAGYLAALHDVEFRQEYINHIDAPLLIYAQKLAAVEKSYLYNFEVSAKQQILGSGRVTVTAHIEHTA